MITSNINGTDNKLIHTRLTRSIMPKNKTERLLGIVNQSEPSNQTHVMVNKTFPVKAVTSKGAKSPMLTNASTEKIAMKKNGIVYI